MSTPLQHNYQNFYGRDFLVTEDVLTPRPETEQLIDAVLSLAGKPFLPGVKPTARKLPENPAILDVGTGSGCIAVTLKKELPDATVIATDVSKLALLIAKKNADKYDADVSMLVSDLLEKVKDNIIPTPDLVVANLPYVDVDWEWLDKTALESDPAIALYADDHGLKLIKQLVDEASSLRIKYLVMEADPCQHGAVIEYAWTKDYSLIDERGFILSFEIG